MQQTIDELRGIPEGRRTQQECLSARLEAAMDGQFQTQHQATSVCRGGTGYLKAGGGATRWSNSQSSRACCSQSPLSTVATTEQRASDWRMGVTACSIPATKTLPLFFLRDKARGSCGWYELLWLEQWRCRSLGSDIKRTIRPCIGRTGHLSDGLLQQISPGVQIQHRLWE